MVISLLVIKKMIFSESYCWASSFQQGFDVILPFKAWLPRRRQTGVAVPTIYRLAQSR